MTYFTTRAVPFAACLTGISRIPRVVVFFATLRAADHREFRMETGYSEGSPRQVRTHTRQDDGALYSSEDGSVDNYKITEMNKEQKLKHKTELVLSPVMVSPSISIKTRPNK